MRSMPSRRAARASASLARTLASASSPVSQRMCSRADSSWRLAAWAASLPLAIFGLPAAALVVLGLDLGHRGQEVGQVFGQEAGPVPVPAPGREVGQHDVHVAKDRRQAGVDVAESVSGALLDRLPLGGDLEQPSPARGWGWDGQAELGAELLAGIAHGAVETAPGPTQLLARLRARHRARVDQEVEQLGGVAVDVLNVEPGGPGRI